MGRGASPPPPLVHLQVRAQCTVSCTHLPVPWDTSFIAPPSKLRDVPHAFTYSVRGRLYVMPAPQLRRSALLITALGHWALRSRTTAMPTGGGSTALRSPGSDDSALLSALYSSRAPLLPPSLPSGRKASFFLGHLPRIMRTGSPSLFALLTKRHGPVFKVGKNTQG